MSSTANAESFSGGPLKSFATAIDAVQIDEIVTVDDNTFTPDHVVAAEEPPSGFQDPVFPVVIIGAISLLVILIVAAALAL